MKIDFLLIRDLLQTIATVAGFTPQSDVQRLLGYASILMRVGEEAREHRTQLLGQVQLWVAEGRGPTTAELDAMQERRDALDLKLAQIEQTLQSQPPESSP